jgi:hypothetical protein
MHSKTIVEQQLHGETRDGMKFLIALDVFESMPDLTTITHVAVLERLTTGCQI